MKKNERDKQKEDSWQKGNPATSEKEGKTAYVVWDSSGKNTTEYYSCKCDINRRDKTEWSEDRQTLEKNMKFSQT